MTRPYRLGRRQPAVDKTAHSILAAARDLVAEAPASSVSVAAIARRAGVSRITVYNRFGSRSGVIRALAPGPAAPTDGSSDARDALRKHFHSVADIWSVNPALFRHLPYTPDPSHPDEARSLAERLASVDALRPGCSLREAEDVIAALSSFAMFDRLHRDGRRPPSAVADVLLRLASGILS